MGRLTRRSLLGLVVGAGLGALGPVSSATEVPDERTQVAAVARDYLESWYTADPDRMGRALHPDMVKRYVDLLPTGRQVVHSLTRDLNGRNDPRGWRIEGSSREPQDRG